MYQGEEVVAVEVVLPRRSSSSTRTASPATCPPELSTRLTQAARVPPVARRSSTMSTRLPGAMASRVYLHRGLAVLEGVARPVGVVRELSRLTQWDQRLGQLDRQGGGE